MGLIKLIESQTPDIPSYTTVPKKMPPVESSLHYPEKASPIWSVFEGL